MTSVPSHFLFLSSYLVYMAVKNRPRFHWVFNMKPVLSPTKVLLSLNGRRRSIESVGVLGVAPNCLQAQVSAGQLKSVVTEEKQILGQVVGTTELSHPLVPNSDELHERWKHPLSKRENKLFSMATHKKLSMRQQQKTPMSEVDYLTYQNVAYVDSDVISKSDYHR